MSKNYCYLDKCGDDKAVQTGFKTQYMVCRACKEEITESLAVQVNERRKRKEENKVDKQIDTPNSNEVDVVDNDQTVFDIMTPWF